MFKPKLIFFGKIAVAIVVLVLLVKNIQFHKITEVYKTAKWNYASIALFLIIPNIWIQSLKWHYLLKLANPAISFATACKSLIIGYPLGFVTPGRLGEMGRSLYVKELNQLKTVKLFIIDKTSNLSVILIFGLTGLFILFRSDFTFSIILALFIIPVVLTGFLCYSFTSASKINSLIKRFTNISYYTGKNNLLLLSYSTTLYLIYLTQLIILVYNFQEVNPVTASQAGASVFLVKAMLPISIGDLGIREGASVFFFGKIGVKNAAAFSAAIFLYLFNRCIPTLTGLFTLLISKRNS